MLASGGGAHWGWNDAVQVDALSSSQPVANACEGLQHGIAATKSRVATVNQGLEGEVQWKQNKLTLKPTTTSTLSPASINVRRRFSRTELSTMLYLEEPVRLEMTEQLNQLLADTMTLRDLYKKSHWQVAGATFYQLHLLFDKHHDE